jgi:hypothetical protein
VILPSAPVGRRVGPLRCRPSPNFDHPICLPNGDVVVCCQDFGLDHVLGNLVRQSWADIAGGPAVVRLRELMKSGECLCRRCEYSESTP